MSIRDYSVVLLSLAVAACTHDLAGPTEKPDLAKGGKPGTGTGTPIPFVKLANLKALGCASADPTDVNTGSPVRVAGWALCGGKMRLWTWTKASGSYLIGDATVQGTLEGVGDNGVMVGGLQGPSGAISVTASGGIASLPLPDGTIYSYAQGMSANGVHAVGYARGLRKSEAPGVVRRPSAC